MRPPRFSPLLLHGRTRSPQRRTFLGLQRPPPPKPHMMGYLVAQGLAIVLLADLAFATMTNEPTTVRAILQQAGLWEDAPKFESVHGEVRTRTGKDGNG